MGPYKSICVLMGPYKSLCVLIDSNGSSWVLKILILFYGFKRVFLGPYRSFCVLKDSNGFFLVVIDPYESLWILVVPYGSL